MTKSVTARYVFSTPISVLMEIMGVETRESALKILKIWSYDMQYLSKHQFDNCVSLEDILEAYPFPTEN